MVKRFMVCEVTYGFDVDLGYCQPRLVPVEKLTDVILTFKERSQAEEWMTDAIASTHFTGTYTIIETWGSE